MADVPMKTLQSADQILGRAACALLQPLRLLRRRRGLAPRVLLVKFWGIGSLQLLTPAVRALRLRHPEAELTLLTLRENEAFARGLGVFDEVWTLDVRAASWPRILPRIVRLLAAVRRARFAEVYDCEFFTRFSAVVSLATGAPRTHGFAAPNVWRGGLHTEHVPFNRYWHVARNFRALAGGEDGTEVEPADLRPYAVTAADRERAVEVLAERGVPADRPLAVLNPNAGSLSLERRWPPASFAALADRLVAEGWGVALVGAPSEVEHTGAVLALSHAARTGAGPVASLAGRLSIGALCALFERAAVVVSNDSGPMHLAAALGRPTLGLFGPETPIMYAPLGERVRWLWEPPVCSPCINVHDNKLATCVRGRPDCLVALTPERVHAELRALLEGGVLHPFPRPAAAERVGEPRVARPSESRRAESRAAGERE